MVLEAITNPFHAEKHVLLLFFIGMLYASIAVSLSYWVFADQAGLVMIIFIVMASVPLFWGTMRYAEKQAIESKNEMDALHRHAKTLTFLTVFFLGMTIAFSIWHVALPDDTSSKIFRVQEATIMNLNEKVTGQVAQIDLFGRIVMNNVKVLVFSLFFSFLFGSGAIFILAWNSSVIGTAMGNFAHGYALRAMDGVTNPATLYFFGVGMSLVRYFTHGIPEILAYFVGGLAGGILSVAIIRGDMKTHFNKITTDFSDLVILAIILLVIAGLIEVFVTPALV